MAVHNGLGTRDYSAKKNKLDIILVMAFLPEKRIYSSYFNQKGIYGRKVCIAARIVGSVGERLKVGLTRISSKVTVQNQAPEGGGMATVWKLPNSSMFFAMGTVPKPYQLCHNLC